MTISNSSSQITVACTGQSSFAFNFVAAAAADVTVSSIASNGTATILNSTQYTLVLNAPAANQLWGVGGAVSFLTPPATGTSLLIQRTVPYTQNTSVQNQGNYFAQVTEEALDLLEMQIQQQVSRTTQYRGIWLTGIGYNVGDIVQDGANGANTKNYYICLNANTSGVWTTDLGNGDWGISALANVPSTNAPIVISGAVTGSGTVAIPTTFAVQGPNSVLANASATSAAPTAISLSSNNLFGMGSTGNINAITLGANLSLAGTVLNAASFSGGSGITIGMTSISSGNNGYILYDNAGTLGQIVPTGSGAAVLANAAFISNATMVSPALGTPASGNLSNCTNIPSSLMTPLGVGSIITAQNGSGGSISAGGTTAASNLTPSRYHGAGFISSGDTISGTWQALQTCANGDYIQWQRTA